jgi:hypothetical protein
MNALYETFGKDRWPSKLPTKRKVLRSALSSFIEEPCDTVQVHLIGKTGSLQ